MRIAFTGAGNTGKTTLLENFLMVWPQYETPDKTYRDFLIEENLEHSSKTTPETQQRVLDFMLDQMANNTLEHVIYDRCPLDNLIYTMWAFEKGVDGFTKEYVDSAIKLSRESMRLLDIIFILRYDESIKIVDDGIRDAKLEYITETDNIVHALFEQYTQNPDADIFFPKGDMPCLIVLPTTPQERIETIGDYIGKEGSLLEETSVLDPKNLSMMEDLLGQQEGAYNQEVEEKKLFEKFGMVAPVDPKNFDASILTKGL